VAIPASEVVKKKIIQNEMSKTFFISPSILKVMINVWCIRRTQFIPQFGGLYNNRGFYLEGV